MWIDRQVMPTLAELEHQFGDIFRQYYDFMKKNALDRVPLRRKKELKTLKRYLNEGKISFQDLLFSPT